MFQVPVTFCYGFAGVPNSVRANIMHEFAACGAKHLVLTSTLISMIMADANLAKKLRSEMSDAGLTFVMLTRLFRASMTPFIPIRHSVPR